jgi:hypothetical protein
MIRERSRPMLGIVFPLVFKYRHEPGASESVP